MPAKLKFWKLLILLSLFGNTDFEITYDQRTASTLEKAKANTIQERPKMLYKCSHLITISFTSCNKSFAS